MGDKDPIMINHSYSSLKSLVDAPNYIFDVKKFEVYFPLIISTLITFIAIYISKEDSSYISQFVDYSRNIILSAAMGLIGLLGFIISGLAIISGTVGNKVTHQLIKHNKYESLLSILFSFYYIGRIIGMMIALLLLTYFLINIPLPFNLCLYLILCFFLCYGLLFTIFFSVSLLGTCINIFQLSYLYSSEDTHQKINSDYIEKYFIDARIDTLTSLFVNKINISKEEFQGELLKSIERDCPPEYKKEVTQRIRDYYNFD
jgi:hypothetical protein